jgi:hypothetical protein
MLALPISLMRASIKAMERSAQKGRPSQNRNRNVSLPLAYRSVF